MMLLMIVGGVALACVKEGKGEMHVLEAPGVVDCFTLSTSVRSECEKLRGVHRTKNIGTALGMRGGGSSKPPDV